MIRFSELFGKIRVELTSAETELRIFELNTAGIPARKIIKKDNLTYSFEISGSDYRQLRRITEKRGDHLRIVAASGLNRVLPQIIKRPILLSGLFLLIMLGILIPKRVFFFRVEGNFAVPSGYILEAAQKSGICFGASRSAVRSEKVKNRLLGALPELQWAGVNTRGCVAIISVSERDLNEAVQPRDTVSSIVADRDGVVLSCTATRGKNVCTVGQAVKKGEMLISGLTDCGLTVTATKAEGEIFAQTDRSLKVISVQNRRYRESEAKEWTRYSLILQKKRINLFNNSGISDSSCVKMYKEYYVTLPGGFRLPFCVQKERIIQYVSGDQAMETGSVEEQLHNYSNQYLKSQMISGQILDYTETIESYDGVCCIIGNYRCVEMIGRNRPEKIGDNKSEAN